MTIRVAIDARMSGGLGGGVEMFVIGLVAGLARDDDPAFEYLLLTTQGEDEWIRPYAHGPVRIVQRPAPRPTLLSRGYQLATRLPLAGDRLTAAREDRRRLPETDGAVERLGAAVMHFTGQYAFTTDIPSIYHPHDLQHVHLPDLFSRRERRDRERRYGEFCRRARLVAVASEWVKRDVESHFGIEPDRVRVVPLAPPVAEYEELSASARQELASRWALPSRFLLYPALTWPHKNHAGLLRAVASLRDRGLPVDIVFTGRETAYAADLHELVESLDLSDRVTWLGFVSSAELRALYQLCLGVVVPTLFEAASFPVLEAFALGVPVAAAAVTSLPEQVGDAGLLFDPRDSSAIAEAVSRLWTDEALRAELAARGRARAAPYTWDGVADRFRALYREAAA